MPIDLPPESNKIIPPKIEVMYKKEEDGPKEDELYYNPDYLLGGNGDSPNLETQDSIPHKRYITKTIDGNTRYYHNPKANFTTKNGDVMVSYALGSTQSPFANLEEMKTSTSMPESLGETDFFTNYINAKSETDTVITDPNTGNRYYNYKEYDPSISGVAYENEKHFNIQRFLIDPHYIFFGTKIKEARVNALYDVYKYFLYQEKGDRDSAWTKANQFIVENVDPLINSKYAKWANENYKNLGLRAFSDLDYYIADHNLFSSKNTTSFPDIVLRHNNEVLSGKAEGRAYSKKEILDILVDYNIIYRKKDPEEALAIASKCIDDALKRYADEVDFYTNRPITEYRVVKEIQYPPGFNKWNEEEKFIWLNDEKNKELRGEIQEKFTEEDRKRILEDLKRYRFVD